MNELWSTQGWNLTSMGPLQDWEVPRIIEFYNIWNKAKDYRKVEIHSDGRNIVVVLTQSAQHIKI